MIAQSAPYVIGIISLLLLLAVMTVLFDSRYIRDTFKAYTLAYGYTYAIAWAIPAILRAVKKEFTK